MNLRPVVGGVDISASYTEIDVIGAALAMYAEALRNVGDTFVGASNPKIGKVMYARARYADRLSMQIETQDIHTPASTVSG